MAPSTDAVEDTAREFATRFADESFAAAAELLSEDGRDAVVESFPTFHMVPGEDAETAFRRYWYGLTEQYGAFESVGDVTVDDDAVTVELAFAQGSQPLELSVDDGAVTNVSFPVSYTPPEYADESAFTEREVTVDAGDVELGGTLTVPAGETPVPGSCWSTALASTTVTGPPARAGFCRTSRGDSDREVSQYSGTRSASSTTRTRFPGGARPGTPSSSTTPSPRSTNSRTRTRSTPTGCSSRDTARAACVRPASPSDTAFERA